MRKTIVSFFSARKKTTDFNVTSVNVSKIQGHSVIF